MISTHSLTVLNIHVITYIEQRNRSDMMRFKFPIPDT